MLTLLTFNAAAQDVRLFNYSLYCPVKFVEQRLIRLASTLIDMNVDIIFLQELFHHDFQKRFYNILGKTYPYITGMSKPGIKLRLDNELLLLSRYPLQQGKLIRFHTSSLEEKLFTSKGFYHSAFVLPQIGQIDLINFHTTAGGIRSHPEHHRMNIIRTRQIDQILLYAKSLDRVILAGDLNAGPDTSTANYEQVINAGFVDTFSMTNAEGSSWDRDNPLVANGHEHHLPSQRIDHIFINDALSRLLRPRNSKIALDDNCIKTRQGNIPLSDHYGIFTTMQMI